MTPGPDSESIASRRSPVEHWENRIRSEVDQVFSLCAGAIKQLEVVVQYLDTAELDTADLVRWYTEVADIARQAEGICVERVLRYELAASAVGGP